MSSAAPIYLDNCATTAVRAEVVEAMLPYLKQNFGNASSLHAAGRIALDAVNKSRAQVAALLNCSADEIFFTPCGTYSNNVAILGRARFAEANNLGKHLITSNIEHSACLGPAKFLDSQGWEVTYLPVNKEGLIDPKQLSAAIKKETSIISLMWANNEIGSIQPIEELTAIAKEREIFFHTDAIQVAGKLAMDLQKIKVDTLALSGHKFYAPKGIGVLFIRKGVNLMPLIFGGGQEMGLFPGTENVAYIAAIGKAAELCKNELETNQNKLRRLQEILLQKISANKKAILTGPKDIEKRLPGHMSIVFPGAKGEALVMQADLRGLCVSSASACHKGIMMPSHVISALNLSADDNLGSLRISAGIFNNEDECLKAAEIICALP